SSASRRPESSVRKTPWTCIASSRVGVTTMARGPAPEALRRRSTIGSRKARLLPDPVGACITRSRPSSRAGTASAWTATGSVICWRSRAASVRALMPSSANVGKRKRLLPSGFWDVDRDLSRETSRSGPGHDRRRRLTQVYPVAGVGNPVIRISGLHKWFGDLHAVRGVDLEVEPEQLLVLLGQNGAGKSTTLRCAGGILHPDAGRIEFGALS